MTWFFLGQNASWQEIAYVLIGGLVAGSAVVVTWLVGKAPWRIWLVAVVALVAVDLGSGAVANLLPSVKRFYHRHSEGPELPWWSAFLRCPLGFTAVHIYPILLWGILPDAQLLMGVLWYLQLLLATVLMLQVPDREKRPVAGLIFVIVLLMNAYVIPHPDGLGWFMPLLFFKLILGHQVPMDSPEISQESSPFSSASD
jgi:hypothetical protein